MSLLSVTEKFDAKNEILTIKVDIKNLNETLSSPYTNICTNIEKLSNQIGKMSSENNQKFELIENKIEKFTVMITKCMLKSIIIKSM